MTPTAEQAKETVKDTEIVNQQPPAVERKVNTKLTTADTKVDTAALGSDVTKDKKQDTEAKLNAEQLQIKDELEGDIAKGMKVSEAVGKYSKKLDTVDAWCNILPFVGDATSTSASMLFFIVQNQKLSEKYRLPLADKFKAALLQAGDWTLKTIIKAPLNAFMSIPILGWLSYPILAPVNATLWFISDKIFTDNKWTAKLFAKSFEKMLADAEARNKANPDKEQIDVASMKDEMEGNMKKITEKLPYKDKVKAATDKIQNVRDNVQATKDGYTKTKNNVKDIWSTVKGKPRADWQQAPSETTEPNAT